MKAREPGDRVRRRRFGQRGSAAVEGAIVTPLVLAMVFGIMELGLVFKDYLSVAASVRAGVRMASANPRSATFAQTAADRVAATGVAMNFSHVQELWVYKVAATTNFPYGTSSFATCTTCVKFSWDAGTKAFVPIVGGPTWASTSQNACAVSSGGPPDRIGVYLKLRHDALTKFVFTSVDIPEASVLRLEPMPVSGGCQ
jgi:Flp pilus assembly protein TadG